MLRLSSKSCLCYATQQAALTPLSHPSPFLQVGFPSRDPEKLVRALHYTHQLVWIRCAKKTRLARFGQLLGFARATSDGAISATIWDVAVRRSLFLLLPCMSLGSAC